MSGGLLTNDWQQQIEQTRARQEAQRAAFSQAGGVCYDCRDSGLYPPEGYGQVPCTQCERGRTLLARQTAEHEASEVERMLIAGGIPPRRLSDTFDTFPSTQHTAVADLRAFASVFVAVGDAHAQDNGEQPTRSPGQGLILVGSYGTGKTGLLIATLRAVMPRYVVAYHPEYRYSRPINWTPRKPLWFVATTDLFDGLRAGYDNGAFTTLLNRAKGTELLALDDLGAEKPTEWVQERLFGIVNHRYEYELPTFATTNYGLKELAERIGPRVLERLLETCDVVKVEGSNLRKGAR